MPAPLRFGPRSTRTRRSTPKLAIGALLAAALAALLGASAPAALAASLPSQGSIAISCPSGSFCVAVSSEGDAYVSEAPSAAEKWEGPVPVAAGKDLTAVSCGSEKLCVTVDSTGEGFVSSAPATAGSWTAVAIAAGKDLTSVSCSAEARCTATDSEGFSYVSDPVQAGSWTLVEPPPRVEVQTKLEVQTKYEEKPGPPTLAPYINGTPADGKTLDCEAGLGKGQVATLSYEWLVNLKRIAGATEDKYKVPARDEGKHLQCTVKAVNAGGTVKQTSNAVAIPRDEVPAAVGETAIADVRASGQTASFSLDCSTRAVGECTIEATLTLVEQMRGDTIVGVSASRRPGSPTESERTSREARAASDEHDVTVTLGTLKASVKPGHDRALSVSLDATGKALLAEHRGSLPATLTVTGSLIGVMRGKIGSEQLIFKAKGKQATHATRR